MLIVLKNSLYTVRLLMIVYTVYSVFRILAETTLIYYYINCSQAIYSHQTASSLFNTYAACAVGNIVFSVPRDAQCIQVHMDACVQLCLHVYTYVQCVWTS